MSKFCFLFMVAISYSAAAQFDPSKVSNSGLMYTPVDLGLGVGLDYGGLGARLTVRPEKHVGIFGSVGYALSGTGYNVGAKALFTPDKNFTMTAGGMYGYNGAIFVQGTNTYNKLYYGPSVFVGGQLRSPSHYNNYLSIELVLPFRPQQFYDDLNSLKNNPAIKITNQVLPVAISLGYHFGF